ncbi:MAG: hypothetical protein IJ956_09380 [Akkermansia sp.]|nr:hypothetical protein [Akkermansia sp.]
MIQRLTGAALLALAMAAMAQEPQPAAPAGEMDWKAEEAALLKEAAQRGITPDKKAAAVAMANEQLGGYGYLPDADDHVISHSKLFSVSGGDSLRMGAIASHADELYGQIRKLLQIGREHKSLISIRLIGKSSDSPVLNPIRTRINIIEDQPNFQIRIHPGGGIDLMRLDKAIITMVLYEYVLRELDPEAYPDTIGLPGWLVAGIQQAVLWKSGKAERRIYRQLFDQAEMLSPEEVISVAEPEKLDAASREVYEVSCGVLIMSLIDREGGVDQLKNLLASAATSEGTPLETLTEHFHELGVDSSLLNKWWAVELANLALPKASEAMAPLESEKMLQEALTITYFDPDTQVPRPVSIDEVYALMELPNWQKLVNPAVGRLVALSHLCFPGHRPIITEYCRVIDQLKAGADPDAMQSILLPLIELRKAYYSAAVRGRDYLDWYEITFTGKSRGRSFDSYLETMQMLCSDTTGPDTAMSRYLDDIEALYTQKEGSPLPRSLREQARQNRNNKKK